MKGPQDPVIGSTISQIQRQTVKYKVIFSAPISKERKKKVFYKIDIFPHPIYQDLKTKILGLLDPTIVIIFFLLSKFLRKFQK